MADAEAGPYLALISVLILAVVGVQMATGHDSVKLVERVWRKPWVVRLYFVVALLVAAIVFAPEQPPPFIYFQF